MEDTLINRLKKSLKERKISVPEFEKQTGIPKDRVYKWLKRSTGKIDHEDAIIIDKWLGGNLDNVPHETKNVVEEPMTAYIESRRSLERTLENLTADKIKSTSIIEELVGMLKANYPAKPSIPPGFNAPGSEASQTLTKGKKAN